MDKDLEVMDKDLEVVCIMAIKEILTHLVMIIMDKDQQVMETMEMVMDRDQ